MAKTLLTLALVLFGGGTMPGMGSASISWNPDSPKRGEEVTIETDGIPPGTTIKLEWTPPGKPTEVVVGKDGKAKVVVPMDAEVCTASDEESGAEGSVVVQP